MIQVTDLPQMGERISVRWRAPGGLTDTVGVVLDVSDTTPESARRASSFPERAQRADLFPERAQRADLFPERAQRADLFPERAQRAASFPERAQRDEGFPAVTEPAVITVLPWDRGPVAIPWSRVIACRVVPNKAVRPSSTPADLARLMALGWPGLEQERLGGWVLHAGGGFTSRANSALPEGDPDIDLERAIAAVVDFYRRRQLTPSFQLASRLDAEHPLDARLGAAGWEQRARTLVMTRDLRQLPQTVSLPADWSVRWQESPSQEWLDAEPSLHPERLAVLTAVPAGYLTVRSPDRDAPVGVARLVHTHDWVGVSGLWVHPASRNRGVGEQLMRLLTQRGRAVGARFGYLQVLATNTAARGLYERAGWDEHSHYAYRVLDE